MYLWHGTQVRTGLQIAQEDRPQPRGWFPQGKRLGVVKNRKPVFHLGSPHDHGSLLPCGKYLLFSGFPRSHEKGTFCSFLGFERFHRFKGLLTDMLQVLEVLHNWQVGQRGEGVALRQNESCWGGLQPHLRWVWGGHHAPWADAGLWPSCRQGSGP